jgi:hypothetical protein
MPERITSKKELYTRSKVVESLVPKESNRLNDKIRLKITVFDRL